MPTEKRVDKRSALFDSTELESAKKLSAEIKKLKKEHKDNNKKLTAAEAQQLLELYEQLGLELKDKYASFSKKESNAAKSTKKLMKKFAKDYVALRKYKKQLEKSKNKKGFLDIESFYENTRTRTIKIPEKEYKSLSSVGGGLSDRKKVNFIVEEEPVPGVKKGEWAVGYFTEAHPDGSPDKNEYLEDKVKKLKEALCEKYPKCRKFIKSLKLENAEVHEGTEHAQTIRAETYYLYSNSEENKRMIFENIKDYLENEDMPEKVEEEDVLFTNMNSQMKYFAYLDFVSGVLKEKHIMNVKRDNGIPLNTDTTRRNAFASEFADLFGCPEVLAYSEKMNIVTTENGKEVIKKGVIMMPGKGEDPFGIDSSSRMVNRDGMSYENTKNGSLSVAKLQLCDYLLGSTDRHQGNFFLDINEKNKLNEVQGIDNDIIGGADPELSKKNWGIRLSNLRVIPKSMAEIIMNTEPEVIEIMMQGYGFSNKEINNTIDRFVDLKSKLPFFEQAYKNADPNYLDPKIPRIVPDKAISRYSVNEQLACYDKENVSNSNLFGRMLHESSHVVAYGLMIQNQEQFAYEAQRDISTMCLSKLRYNWENINKIAEKGKVLDNPTTDLKIAYDEFVSANLALKNETSSIKGVNFIIPKDNPENPYDFEISEKFAGYKDKVNKALKSNYDFVQTLSNEILESGSGKYEEYETYKAEIDYYEKELKKETLSEEIKEQHLSAIDKLKISMLALEQDPEIMMINAARKNYEDLLALQEKINKFEKAYNEIVIGNEKRNEYKEVRKEDPSADNSYEGSETQKRNKQKVLKLSEKNKKKVKYTGKVSIDKVGGTALNSLRF